MPNRGMEKRIFRFSPFRDIASSGAFCRIFTVAFDMLFYVRLGYVRLGD